MSKMRILSIGLASFCILAGSAMAGPTKGPGVDGDPDSPMRAIHGGQPPVSDPARAQLAVDVAQPNAQHEPWVRALRVYFRFSRFFAR